MPATATTSLENVARQSWDAIVIGAGPAGSLAARGLVQRGIKTLLVDRKMFPRDKVCGCCIGRRALSLLEHAGLRPDLEKLAGVPLTHANIAVKSQFLRVSLPGGVAISRAEFDEALVQSAIAEGAEFLPGVNAFVRPRNLTESSSRRTVELSAAGVPTLITAAAIVAADGLGHPSLRHCLEFADHVSRHSRIGLGTTLGTDSWELDFGCVTLAVGRSGYVGAVRLWDGQFHLAASVDRRALRSEDCPGRLISQILKESHLPAIGGLDQADWQGTVCLTRRSSCVGSDRVFLVGDAAGYVEPFTGEGIAWAITTGLAVPAFVKRTIEQTGQSPEQDWQECYRALIRRRQTFCQALMWLLKRPMLASAAVRLMRWVPPAPQFVADRLNRPLPAADGNSR